MRVSKWGNSLAVRLPKALVEDLELRAGDQIEVISKAPGRLVYAQTSDDKGATARQAIL